jgi:two-component system cell cycle response regulator
VESSPYAESLLLEIGSGRFDAVLLDHSLPLDERLALVRSIREKHPTVPVVLVFRPGAEQEVVLAKTAEVTDCVMRDRDGAYLFKIPDIMDKIANRDENVPGVHRTTPGIDAEDVTDRLDLAAIAKEVKGAIVDSQKAAFLVLAGPDVGTVTQLNEPLLLIGRDTTCHMELKDDSISRFHASVKQHSSGVVTIRDLNSTNGTYIDGKRIQIEELKEGDKILLGLSTVIKYQTQDSIDQSYHDELFFSSTTDELTGVYNRRYSLEKIKTDLSYAKRHGLPVSLMLFDLDHFKRINDTHGHLMGDSVLANAARVAAATVRQEDILGRYGGEEFVIFALDTDLKGAKILANRIRQRIARQAIRVKGGPSEPLRVTVSLGIATALSAKGYDMQALISKADENLYKAKENGRNRLEGTVIG